MDDKSAGTESLGESAYFDAVIRVELEEDKVSVTLFGALFITIGNAALNGSSDVDVVLGVKIKEHKLSITGLNSGSSISILFLSQLQLLLH